MQNLHYDSKDSESRLKIDVRVECKLDSRGDGVTGVRSSCGIVCGSLNRCQQNF